MVRHRSRPWPAAYMDSEGRPEGSRAPRAVRIRRPQQQRAGVRAYPISSVADSHGVYGEDRRTATESSVNRRLAKRTTRLGVPYRTRSTNYGEAFRQRVAG